MDSKEYLKNRVPRLRDPEKTGFLYFAVLNLMEEYAQYKLNERFSQTCAGDLMGSVYIWDGIKLNLRPL